MGKTDNNASLSNTLFNTFFTQLFFPEQRQDTQLVENFTTHTTQKSFNHIVEREIIYDIWGASGQWMIAPNKTSLLLVVLLLLLFSYFPH